MDPFIGEIRAVGFNYAPRGWALCDGSTLAIRSNTALFAILGTSYGGDGVQTFKLPDLRSRAIVDAGQGPGLSSYPLGTVTGAENVTLDLSTMPAHTHGLSPLTTHDGTGTNNSPSGTLLADSADFQYGEASTRGVTMAAGMIKGSATAVGGNLPHPNLMPYLVVNYIIATTGIFPPRS
jgi:microcystin-dependent protein